MYPQPCRHTAMAMEPGGPSAGGDPLGRAITFLTEEFMVAERTDDPLGKATLDGT
jgi:hypothetical protein